ncbi:NAD(P)/FAD-dependent oxidoreductase [Cyanobacterium stanieri LEGE 03274]|uniref:NAD(P)/FAD-dependent oxidoreductase n=1 Tax=Cyanobacterium stanieri LEGE 03274 TaxID=1828756 RepID=A0ABR9V2B5_9CHRO|nr:NAD-binding protein [Cyanobacterium stanieri]MBE9221256.1 NAD(P)/FAD-dependent oxidoreductase [Cyanobacterium stanieri LEGE 03274]
MKLTYDLILIGGSLEAIWGAKYAVNIGARVALIIDVDFDTEEGQKYLFQQLQSQLLSPNSFHNRQDILEEKKLLIESKLLPELEGLEVDVIFSDFEFVLENNQTAIKTKQDILMANGYIITSPLYNYQHPDWLGIEDINYLTGYDIFQLCDIDSLPNNLVVIGDDEVAINICGLLSRYQKKVTLLTTQKHILPWEDEDITFLIQCELESIGVNVLSDYQVNQVKSINNSKWIQAGNTAIEGEEIIISNDFLERKFNFKLITLQDKKFIKVDKLHNSIIVNSKLQTSYNKIYSVGNILGGYGCLNIVKEELRIAIDNILFLKIHQINYDVIPYNLNVSKGIFRVGYNESQVKSLYGDSWDSFIINDSFLSPFDLERKAFFVKLIVSKNRKFLGCHCWGYKAELLVNIVAMLIKKDSSIDFLFKMSISDDFIKDIINRLEQKIMKKYHPLKCSLLETWFIWHR